MKTRITEEAPASVPSTIGSVECSSPPNSRTRRRSSQSRTTYQLAHPPPSTRQRQRFRLRPKTLLQLQQISHASRPIPLFDVVPSILFAPRLAWRVPRILQNKQGLGLDDLVFVQSRPQASLSTSTEQFPWNVEQDEKTDREIVAAICQSNSTERNAQRRTEIRFSHGSTWWATALQSGAYELVSYGQAGSTSIARWVPKRDDRKVDETGMELTRPKFKFSLVDVKSRRHPVIANMSMQCIDIYDRYSIPCSPQTTPRQDDPASFQQAGSVDSRDLDDGESIGTAKTVIETDDELRTMIAISGVWVACCEHWLPNFQYSTKQVISNEISELSNLRRINGRQPLTFSADDGSRQRPSTVDGSWHRSSLSPIYSSPSRDSPRASPRRTASTSTTIVGDDDNHHSASFETEYGMISMDPYDPNNGTTQMNRVADNAGKPSGRAEHVRSQGTFAQRVRGGPSNAVAVVEGTSKRPGAFRRVVSRLRRTRSDF
ncbi:MAG: hypothetical protein LQ337_004203 [Flavoplaca oasis]|nr:MAG: hypothetical protein LQ337_004203 [Flavoplaca oasis]